MYLMVLVQHTVGLLPRKDCTGRKLYRGEGGGGGGGADSEKDRLAQYCILRQIQFFYTCDIGLSLFDTHSM